VPSKRKRKKKKNKEEKKKLFSTAFRKILKYEISSKSVLW